MTLGTVKSTAPLTVKLDGSGRALPAKLAGGVSLTLATDLRVLVESAAGRLYVMGGA